MAALAAFKTSHGAYPDKLTELVPEFLVSIEPPVAGMPAWKYGRNDKGFELVFGVEDYYYPCCYTSESGIWKDDR